MRLTIYERVERAMVKVGSNGPVRAVLLRVAFPRSGGEFRGEFPLVEANRIGVCARQLQTAVSGKLAGWKASGPEVGRLAEGWAGRAATRRCTTGGKFGQIKVNQG